MLMRRSSAFSASRFSAPGQQAELCLFREWGKHGSQSESFTRRGYVRVRLVPSAAARHARQARRRDPGRPGNIKSYPTPVRILGGDYSQTRCVGGDGGTTVNLSPLDKILEFGETTVRAQAGVRVGTLARALAERGQELPLTPEMGHMSLGAVAVTTLAAGVVRNRRRAAVLAGQGAEADHAAGQADDRDRAQRGSDARVELELRSARASCTKSVLRVQPLTPVRIEYQVLTLKEFSARFPSIVKAPGALRLHISPFKDQITVERRTLDETANINRSGIWQIAQIRHAQRIARIRFDRRQRAGGARRCRCRGVGRAAGAARDARPRGAQCGAVRSRMDARLAAGSLEVALHLYVVGVSASRFPETARRVFRVLQNRITSSTVTAATSSTARAACTRIAIRCSA